MFRQGHRRGRCIKRPFFVALALGACLAPAHAGVPARQSYVITSFDSIRVEAPVNVEIVTSGGVSARGEGSRSQLDRVDMQVSGGLLVVRLRAVPESTSRSGGASTLYLSTGPIRRAIMVGGGKLHIDRLKGQSATLSISGNGDVTVDNVALDRLNILSAGSGRMALSGKAGQIDARIQGAGTILGGGLLGRDVAVYNDGPGEITLNASRSAAVTASGSGDTIIRGVSACTVKQRGTGHIICGGKDY